MRRAISAAVITAGAVALVVSFKTRPAGSPAPARPTPRVSVTPTPTPPGTRSATGIAITTPFSVVQVRATLTHGRLTGVQTVALSGEGPHTQALNARAEPILRAEALKAHSAHVDVVSGATVTSESWIQSLQSAIDRARRR